MALARAHSIRYDLAVIIATLDRDELLRSTIDQIARQRTLPGTCIVVDQGQQSSKERLLLPLRKLGVRCLHTHSSYRSISAARNVGLTRCRCPRILFLDDDVELESDVVAEHSRYFDEDPSTVAVAGHVTCEPRSAEFERLNTFRPEGEFVRQGRGCHMSFLSAVLREIGGFNAYICNSGDETELYRRLIKAGYRVRNGGRAVVKHLVAPHGGNRVVRVRSHADFERVVRDGMVRSVKDRGAWAGIAWPIKNWNTIRGLVRTAPSPWHGLQSAMATYAAAWRLAFLSRSKRDYIRLSVKLASGAGVDPSTGLPVV